MGKTEAEILEWWKKLSGTQGFIMASVTRHSILERENPKSFDTKLKIKVYDLYKTEISKADKTPVQPVQTESAT